MQSDFEQQTMTTERIQTSDRGDDEARQFRKLLESHDPRPPRRGQILEGEIIKLKENLAIIDVGAKRDAIVPPEEMDEVNESYLDQLDEGDSVPVYVLRTPFGDEELMVSLEKGQRAKDWERAAKCLENQEVLQLKVIGKNKGGLLLEFGRLRGFVPNSHVPALANIYDRKERMNRKAEMIDSTLMVKVLETGRKRKRLVLSAKKAEKEARQQRLQELKQEVGETAKGRVTNLVDFGAFVELDGVEGLIHISEIAWQKVEEPAQFLKPGEEVDVLVQSVDVENERVSLSRKALMPSPWETYADKHTVGELVEGIVTNVVDFGAFVQVAEGIEGLIHVSEMHQTRASAPQDVLFPDDSVLVRILDIQPERQRLALSQRRVSPDEEVQWIGGRKQGGEADPIMALKDAPDATQRQVLVTDGSLDGESDD